VATPSKECRQATEAAQAVHLRRAERSPPNLGRHNIPQPERELQSEIRKQCPRESTPRQLIRHGEDIQVFSNR